MLLKNALDDKMLDYRICDRLLEEGKIKQEDLDKYLTALEDDSNNVKKSDD